MSSADSPSTLSTTDLGRSFRPCKLFRLIDKCGVAYNFNQVIAEANHANSKLQQKDDALQQSALLVIQKAKSFLI
jgi:hypothetical protein